MEAGNKNKSGLFTRSDFYFRSGKEKGGRRLRASNLPEISLICRTVTEPVKTARRWK
jgi:hypothetical protein